MKNKKILITAVIVLTLAVIFTAVACEKAVDQLDLTLSYAGECTSLKVEVAKDEQVVYVYDNGKVTDEYDLGIDVSAIVAKAGENGLRLKKSDFKDGFQFKIEGSKASLSGQFANAAQLIGVDVTADVSIKADLDAKSVSEYKVSYTDARGYNVVITLSK